MSKKPTEEPRHFTHGSSGAMADAATEAAPRPEDHTPHAPHAKPVAPRSPNEKPDQLAETVAAGDPVSAHHIT